MGTFPKNSSPCPKIVLSLEKVILGVLRHMLSRCDIVLNTKDRILNIPYIKSYVY